MRVQRYDFLLNRKYFLTKYCLISAFLEHLGIINAPFAICTENRYNFKIRGVLMHKIAVFEKCRIRKLMFYRNL